jgi:very-short-patch-repair endonuclease
MRAVERVARVCQQCGARFFVLPSDLRSAVKKRGEKAYRYCSARCATLARRGNPDLVEPGRCAVCGREFTKRHAETRYCSLKCAGAAAVVLHQCERCRTVYRTVDGHGKDRRFCSAECARRESALMTKRCLRCGREFTRSRSSMGERNRYCSTACQHAVSLASARAKAKAEHGVDLTCKFCGTPFHRSRRYVERGNGIYCSAACQAKDPPSDATREKMRQNALSRIWPKRRTRIELAMEAEFTRLALPFEAQKVVASRCRPDFVFEDARVVVECDGDYWHSLPHAIESGRRLDAALTAEGWRVLRLWEHEIKSDAAGCAAKVAGVVSIR